MGTVLILKSMKSRAMKLMTIFMQILCILIIVSCSSQVQSNGYECLMEWARHPQYPLSPYMNVGTDSLFTPQDLLTCIFNGEDSIPLPDKTQSLYMIYPAGTKKGLLGTSYSLLSSKPKKKTVSLDFEYKTENLSLSCLRIYKIGDGETATQIDSIPLTSTDTWTYMHKDIPLRSPSCLHVSIEVAGDTAPRVSRLFMDHFLISYKGKSLKTMTDEYQIKPVEPSDVLTMDSLMTSPILDKKILGLGETTHGTVTLQDITFDIMKERILHHSCTLILFELPLERSFMINRYVKNDERFHLEDIRQAQGDGLYSDSIYSFLQWVKEYNRYHDNVVSVFGMACEPDNLATGLYLNDFIEVFDSAENGIWHPLCRAIMAPEWRDPIAEFEADDLIKKVLTAEEVALLRYAISERVQRFNEDRFANRDNIMPNTVRLFMNLYNPSAITIHAHFGHVNYLSNMALPHFFMLGSPSTGNFLKQTFEEDYACIALSQGCGQNYDWSKRHTVSLEESSSESLEYWLSSFDIEPVYLSMDDYTFADWCKIRWVGNSQITTFSEFVDVVPKSRMDGIIVVKETSPISYNIHSIDERNNEITYRFMRTLSKYSNEQKICPQ